MIEPADLRSAAAKHRELATIATRLDDLRAQYDVLMNAFKFDEARRLHARIEAAEREHRQLAASLPALPPASSPAPYRVSARRRRR